MHGNSVFMREHPIFMFDHLLLMLGHPMVLIGHRACRDAGGTFVVSGLQPAVSKLVSISQLDSVLKIVPTAQEGVDLVYMEEVERDI